MNSDNKSNNSSWFFSALTLLFIGLKLTHYITWSWWWVLAPAWMPAAAIVVGAIVYFLIEYAYNGNKSESQKLVDQIIKRKNSELKHESKFMKALREAEERSNARNN